MKRTKLALPYECMSQELLKAVRGKLSQRRSSAILGVSENQFSRWESGEVRIPWDAFVRFCERRGKSILNALNEALCLVSRQHLSSKSILKYLISSEQMDGVMKELQLSKKMILNSIQGRHALTLPIVLGVVEVTRRSSHLFVQSLAANYEQNLFFIELFRQRHALIHLQEKVPIASLILRIYDVVSQDPSLRKLEKNGLLSTLSKRFAVSRSQLKEVHELLEDLKLLSYGEDGWSFAPLSLSLPRKTSVGVHDFWLQAIAQNFSERGKTALLSPKTVFGHNVFSISEKNWLILKMEYQNFYGRMRTLIRESDSRDPHTIKIASLHFWDWEDLRSTI